MTSGETGRCRREDRGESSSGLCEGLQAPSHLAFIFVLMCGCIRGVWTWGHHRNPKHELGCCCSVWVAKVAGVEQPSLTSVKVGLRLQCVPPSPVQQKGSGEIGIQRCAWGLISPLEILLGTLPIPSLSPLLMTAG